MLAVSVIVAGPPSIALSAQSATFAAAGGANPPQQQVQVTNGGGGSLSGLATSVAYGGGASGWLSATLTATTAPAAITLGVASSALATGTYTATVTVTASGAASKTIAVTLTVAPAGLAVPIASWPALANVGGIAGSVGQVQGTPTAVVRTGANGFAAYSMRCPHQGTTVRLENWQGTGSAFHCPNHDALFDSSGTLLPGSPQQTSNMLQRTVTYTPGDAVLYVS
jgi:Rieske Fe-S protein